MRLWTARAALLACLALPGAGCDLGSSPPSTAPTSTATGPAAISDFVCRAKDGKIGLSWGVSAGAYAYRVARSQNGAAPESLGEVASAVFTDYSVSGGIAYRYTVTPLGVDAEGAPSSPCDVTAPSLDGPAAPAGLQCRPKDGKIDVTWNLVPQAATYRVYRTGGNEARNQVAETSGHVHADVALQNGFSYGYDVVAVDGRGRASVASAVCTASPGPRQTGTAPPAISNLTCRGKNDKVDLTFTPVGGAAFYRVYRSDAGAAATPVGETTGGVFVNFGLTLGTRYEFSVESVGAGGAASPRSAVCALTASGRVTGALNKPPVITSQPLTSALEDHLYYYRVVATDPEAGPITYALLNGPGGMEMDPQTGFLSWSPSTSQIGPSSVEVRATDALGAFATQAFSVDAQDFDEPPTITSIPGRTARAGQLYRYPVQAFDPEGKTLTYAFATPTPTGISIDPATGLVTWTPQAGDAGSVALVVRALDPSGQFDTQRFDLLVTSIPLDLVAPTGERVVRPGETLRLDLVANQEGAGFKVTPAPPNAKLKDGKFEFTPTLAQQGTYDLGFEAVLGDQHDVNPVRIRVERVNASPQLSPLSAATVREGETLRVVASGSDPDSDPLSFSAPGLALANAVFDELTHTFVFTPSFEQAGSYEATIAVSDGRETVTRPLAITVLDAPPPVTDVKLAVDPPQNPTFRATQTISGSIDGSTAGPPAGNAPLLVGLSPVAVRQGREAIVTVTGRDTQFVAGGVSANFGEGVAVSDLVVVSPTQLRVTVRATADAALGVRRVSVRQESGEATSVVAFSVEAGAADLSGVLVDSFTGAPLANARVTVQGSLVTTTTDAQGRFVLAGVPPGERKIVVATANYAVKTLDLAVQANLNLDLGSAVGLDALARAFSVGGSLARAATLASVLDRGVSERDGDLTLEQARAVVVDTMLAIGGDEFGVVDEAGNQLNPNLNGPGMLSLGPVAVDLFAERLLRGETYRFGELATILEGTFGWLFPSLTEASLTERLQAAADRAWAKPSDPASTLAILLLNEGRTLDAKPPVITQETTFNAFQAFLYLSDFLAANFQVLDAAINELLVRQGIDPNGALIGAGFDPNTLVRNDEQPGFVERFARRAGALVGAALVPAAHAAGPTDSAANTVKSRGIVTRAGTVVGKLGSIASSTLLAGIIAAAFTAFLVILGAVTGGPIFGLTLASIGTAFVGSLISAFVAKVMIAFIADPDAVERLTPTPAAIVQNASAKAAGQDKIMIPFQRSEGDLQKDALVKTGQAYESFYTDVVDFDPGTTDPRRLEYRYHLWKVPSNTEPVSLSLAKGARLISTRTQPVRGHPELLRFVIPKTDENAREGTNYYVVVAVQFYRRMYNVDPDLDPNDEQAVRKALEVVYADLTVPAKVREAEDFKHSSISNAIQNMFSFVPKYTVLDIDDIRRLRNDKIFQEAKYIQEAWDIQQQSMAKWNDTALATAARAQTVDDEIRLLEDNLKNLRNTRADALGRIATSKHRDVLNVVCGYLSDPANAGKQRAAIIADLTDISRPPGSTIKALMPEGKPGAQAALEKMVSNLAGSRQLELRLLELEKVPDQLTRAKQRIQVAQALAERTGKPVPLDIPALQLSTLEPPRTFSFPTELQPDGATAREALSQMETERSFAAGVQEGLDRQLKVLDKVMDLDIDDFQRQFLTPDERLQKQLATEIEVTRARHAEAVRQKNNLLALDGRLQQERELLDTVDTSLRQKANIELGIDARIDPSPSDATVGRQAEMLATERRFKPGKIVGIVGESFGWAADIGAAAWEARDKILVLRSKPSSVITVEIQNGEIVHTADAGDSTAVFGGDEQVQLASVTHPIERHPALPDRSELPFAVRAFFPGSYVGLTKRPLVMDDSGAIAGAPRIGSERWRRELAADRRAGVAPMPVQFQGAAGFPAQFETDRAASEFGALLHGTGPQGANKKGGFLVRDYPFTEPDSLFLDAGFPSDVMAVDSRGATYLVNANSTLEYGGRIFKYSGSPVVREHVGSVSYYSLDLQYARPTQPIAMEAAEGWTSAYGIVEDLFVAERDPGVYIGQGIQGVNRILRVGIHQTTRLPFYANGKNRQRLVGQPYAEHPDFRFTGPSDIEMDSLRRNPDPLVPMNLYVSDEENIFVVSDRDKNGQGEVAKIVSVPGRRWSGLALDRNGNLFFADYESGELFLLPSREIDLMGIGASQPIASNEELDSRAFLIKVDLANPGDVELDTWEQRYLVSTRRGYEAFNVPIVGRLSDDIKEMHVDIVGREVPVTPRRDRGNIFIAGSGSEGPYGKTIRIRVQREDPVTRQTETRSSTYNTMPLGATVLTGPL